MSQADNYINTNRQLWNNKTDIHISSDFYDQEAFLAGKNTLNEIELELLGNVRGKRILHLQCHFGQDSISLSRLGAEVTAIDLSDVAIERARHIAKELNEEVNFICCDLYDLTQHLEGEFDIVFTSYGTIAWLPDLDRWAQIISKFLKPSGKFVFAEFHPLVWMFDDDFTKVAYGYFNQGAIVETETGTYAEKEAEIEQEFVVWNHSLADVISNLISKGIQISDFKEFDYSPYDCFNHTEEFSPGRFRIKPLGNKAPLVYALLGTKE